MSESTGMSVTCVCETKNNIPLVYGDNGEWIDGPQLAFFWTCSNCGRTIQVNFEEISIQFFKE